MEMNDNLLSYIRKLSMSDTKTLSQKALKTAEEAGELAKWVLPYDNAFATTHRFVGTDKILEEVADVTLAAMSVAYSLGYTDNDLFSMMETKAQKWEKLQQDSSAGYPLPYEIHVTVTIKDDDLFLDMVESFDRVCKNIGVKPIILNLRPDTTQTYISAMTSSKHIGNNRTAYEEANRVSSELSANGFVVSRVKIETVPWHPAALNNQVLADDAQCHFEVHLPIQTVESNIPALRTLCESTSLHLSQNTFKRATNGEIVIMATFRSRDKSASEFAHHADYLAGVLAFRGFKIHDYVVEFCVYDSSVNADNTWLMST